MPLNARLSPAACRFALFLGVVAATLAVALLRYHADLPLTPEQLRTAVRAWGRLAPVVFAGAFALRPFIFFPSSLLFLAGGLAFGAAWGTVYAAAGATLGAIIGFSIARALGREFVQAQLGDRFPVLLDQNWGAGIVLVLNLIPIVPMTAINYGAGLSSMALLPFIAAVAAGIVPRAFAYSFFGQSLLDVGSREFVLAVALLATLIIAPLYVRRQIRKRAARALLQSDSPPGLHIE